MRAASHNSVVVYNDITLFLLLIPFINALNYFLTYTNISLNTHFIITFTIDTLQGYAAWFAIRSIIIFLDKKMPYQQNPLKRILWQLLFTSMTGLLIIIITTEIINALVKDTPVPSSFYRFDIFIFLIWFFVINGIYIGWYYYKLWDISEKQRNEEKKIRQDGFIIKQGKQNFHLQLTDVIAIYVEGNYAMLLTSGFKKHLLDQSLEKVEKQLPGELFFRINRQYILHRQIITGFEKVENGKINVIVAGKEYLPASIQMSRTKAPAFKQWFNPEK